MDNTRISNRGISVYPGNPYYWQYGDKPVLLLGGSAEDNLFQIPNLADHLDLLARAGGNYVRCTMSSRDEGDVWPFLRQGERYDLDRWAPEHWRRFSAFLEETKARGIIVQIEVWDPWDYCLGVWDRNPFNPKNNVNYTAQETGLPKEMPTPCYEWDDHPGTGNSFFWSVPAERSQETVLRYQRRLVDEMLAHTLKYDHVLYCMDNETSVTAEWGSYWATYIREAASKLGKSAHTTEMWDPWDLTHPLHRATIEHPEIYTFIEVSQNNMQEGQQHYDAPQRLRQQIADAPRPLNNVKIYGADSDGEGHIFATTKDGVERFWRNIFGGLASARFHRPPAGQGLGELGQRMIRAAREVTDAIALFSCQPRPDLLLDQADKQVKENKAYCLANPGKEYAVYFPDGGGGVRLDLGDAKGDLQLRWYHIDAGRWHPSSSHLAGGDRAELPTPALGQWAAVIQRR